VNAIILIIEDDNDVRELLEEILITSGYKVIPATDALHAFELLNSGPTPDLIISDIMMPGKTGTEFFQELRERYSYLHIPFIFLTAKSDDSDCRDGMNMGADDYLKKPFKTKDLLRSIELRLMKKKSVSENLRLFSKSLAINIPHELKTPLVPIIGLSELILEDDNHFSKDEINKFVGDIRFSGLRLKDRIIKLLIYQELEILDLSNHYNLDKIPSSSVSDTENLPEILLGVANKFGRSSDLKINITKADLLIIPEHLDLLLKELTENSFKFSLPDSIVEITGRIEDQVYKFYVTDNGSGMQQNDIESILFNSGYPVERYNPNYTGFGLFIVRKILKIYRSYLTINSILNSGSTFSFSINLKNNNTILS
jgi:CheY-like chemotaxis protein